MQRVLANFVIFTLVVLLAAGMYIWLTNYRQVTSLDYIQDMDWSEWQSISPAIHSTGIYDALIDKHGHLHLVWLEYSQEAQAGQLIHTEVNSSGTVLQEPEEVLTNRRLSDMSLIFQQNRFQIFWFGEGEDGTLNLMYSEFDHEWNELRSRQIMSGTLTRVEDLQAVMAQNGEFMLTWVDVSNENKQVKALWLDEALSPKGETQQITWAEHGSHLPNVAVDAAGAYHLVWLEKYPPANQKITMHDYNIYKLYYQMFNGSGEPLSVPQLLDNVALSLPVLAVTKDRLYITWNKVLPYKITARSLEQALPKYRVFGMEIQLTDPVQLGQVTDLTGEGVAFNQSLAVDTVGQLHMVYYKLVQDRLVLAQETFIKGFSAVKPSSRIFPNHEIFFGENQLDLKYGTMLLPDPVKGVHLIWFNSSSIEGDQYFYSNTVRPVTISALQIIGIDKQRMTASIVMSVLFAIGLAVLGVFGYTMIFALCSTVLLGVILRLEKKAPWLKYLRNPYLATAVLCFANFLFTLLGLQQAYFWQGFYGWEYLGAVFIIASAAAAVFVFVNRNHTKPVVLAGVTSVFWIYWLNVASLMFFIPGMVF